MPHGTQQAMSDWKGFPNRMPRIRIWSAFFGCFLLLACTRAPAATYTVSSISELNSRISSAVAGDTIIVSNGIYTTTSSIAVTKVGTAASPITIQAQTIGGVEIKGTHGFNLNSPAAYIVIQGFKFTHTNSLSVGTGTSHCRFTRNTIQLSIGPTNDISYINISGDDVQIDYNELRNKSTLGEMLDISGSGSQVARRLWVHHNYFHDFTSPGGNGAETVRWGLSGLSLSTGNGLCEYNLFVRCEGENEMISNKSSGNTYRYNTVLDCVGGEISQRHGNDCYYYANYMRNTQGMRIYGDRHRIFSNYFESNSVAVNMGNGDGDVYNGDPLTSHDRPDDNIVIFNTFVNNDLHYEMGGRTGGLGSSNTVVANNVFQGGGNMASVSSSAPYTGSWSNNIHWQTSSTGDMPATGYLTVNPLLARDTNGEYHVQSGSPAINAGVGAYDYYGVFSAFSYVTNDMDGQLRDASPDIGADEFSTSPIAARILTVADVGPMAGLSNRPPANLRWVTTNNGIWDVGTSLNWLNLGSNTLDVFLQGDSVLLDDTAAGQVVTNISLNSTVLPAALTNDSTIRNYTISGSGGISGSAALIKKGSATLTINTVNDFGGGVSILGGILQAGSSGALGSTSGGTFINGGTLDVNGFSFNGEPVTAAGSGAGGQGAIINNGGQQTSALRNLALTNDVTFGGTGRWDIRAASSSSTTGCALITSGQPWKITKVGTNQVSLVAVSVDLGLGDIDVKEGMFAIQTVTSQLGNPARSITVFPGATLELWNLNTAPLNKRLVLSNNATLWNENGNSIIVGPVILTNGMATFNIGGTSVAVSNNIITGAGGLTKTGAGTLTLRGINTFSGPTVISAGILGLAGVGSLNSSSVLTIGSGAVLDVTGRSDSKLTLANGQVLSGDGTLTGSLLASPGSIVSPGILTVSSAVTLQGTTLMQLTNVAGTNDMIKGAPNITYGGTLQLTNLVPVGPGANFQLFSAGSYSGAFTNIIPAIPGINLGWNTNTLSSGVLSVVAAPTPNPQITALTATGGTLMLAATNGVPGWPCLILTSTNVASPLSQWTVLATNTFDSKGGLNFITTFASDVPQTFYSLRLQ
ncbi:MAG TPA: chondroitinase-B domain-containing protein [Candidatus Dormibacteraeota bacterium]|nr:chondroitinase-B domain-containing protein [Candidatus Dormibacteraeota bacterium]